MDINADSPWKQASLWVNENKVEWGAEIILVRGQDNDVRVEVPPTIAAYLNLGLAEDVHGAFADTSQLTRLVIATVDKR
jgi:hypothetical protein